MHHVGVTGHDDGIDALVGGLFTQCAQNIVGFEAFQFVDGDIESLHQLSDPPELPHQFRRGFGTCRLVLFKHLMAEGRRCFVKSHGVMRGFEVIDGFQQNGSEAVNRPHRFAGLADGKRRQSVESAVYQPVPVKEH